MEALQVWAWYLAAQEWDQAWDQVDQASIQVVLEWDLEGWSQVAHQWVQEVQEWVLVVLEWAQPAQVWDRVVQEWAQAGLVLCL